MHALLEPASCHKEEGRDLESPICNLSAVNVRNQGRESLCSNCPRSLTELFQENTSYICRKHSVSWPGRSVSTTFALLFKPNTETPSHPPSFTYRLSLVPLGVELLVRFQAKESISGHVIHLVVHNPVRLGIQTLQQLQIITYNQHRLLLAAGTSLYPEYCSNHRNVWMWFQPREGICFNKVSVLLQTP